MASEMTKELRSMLKSLSTTVAAGEGQGIATKRPQYNGRSDREYISGVGSVKKLSPEEQKEQTNVERIRAMRRILQAVDKGENITKRYGKELSKLSNLDKATLNKLKKQAQQELDTRAEKRAAYLLSPESKEKRPVFDMITPEDVARNYPKQAPTSAAPTAAGPIGGPSAMGGGQYAQPSAMGFSQTPTYPQMGYNQPMQPSVMQQRQQDITNRWNTFRNQAFDRASSFAPRDFLSAYRNMRAQAGQQLQQQGAAAQQQQGSAGADLANIRWSGTTSVPGQQFPEMQPMNLGPYYGSVSLKNKW